MESSVRTRFAPSPTGYLHVGGARTALFNYLYAKKSGGSFVLRVEDTDQERNTETAREAIFQGLNWLGLSWDEGPHVGGDHGPYQQSQRYEIYLDWFEKLKNTGRLYQDDGAWRFRFERKVHSYRDLVCGEVSVDYTQEDITPDLVIRRSDGSFVFHFVNVIDDLTMRISHVIRGEDHLSNTLKHLQLFEALGVTPPAYAHIPLILNPNGSKMSKRDQGAALGSYPEQGFLPSAVNNFLALLGWSPKDESEIFDLDSLRERFDFSGVNRSPAKFDFTKCRWVNQQHLARLSADEFANAAKPAVAAAGLPTDGPFAAIVASVQEKVSQLSEIPAMIAFFSDPEFPIDPEALAKLANQPQLPVLLNSLAKSFAGVDQWNAESAKQAIQDCAQQHETKPGKLMFPTRVALSGQTSGPDLGEILNILGRDESVRRTQRLLKLL